MHNIALKILLTLSAIMGIESHPSDSESWNIIKDWEKTPEGYLVFVAESDSIACTCRENPSAYIEFPNTIHSSTQVMLGDQVIAMTSSPDFEYTKGFYSSLSVPCYQLMNSEGPLTWKVISYTEYFAWFQYFPKITEGSPIGSFFTETLNVIASGVLLILCLLYLIIFSGRIPRKELSTLFFANLFTAVYFIGTVVGFMGIDISMLTAHRIADTGLWLGFTFFIQMLFIEKLIPRWMDITYKASVVVGLMIILTANTGDTIQLGTTVPFGFTLFFILYAVWNLANKHGVSGRKELLQFIGLSSFLITYSNDLFVVTGVIDSFPILPIGIMGSYVFILLSVNERITKTYTERDELKILTEKLKQTQDKLVKSEKMAAMGRAVARIAHELNSPIYVARSSAQNILTQTKKFSTLISEGNKEKMEEFSNQFKLDIGKMGEGLINSVNRAAELIRNFKEISTDQVNIKPKEFELLGYIKTCLNTLEESLKRNNIVVNLKGDEVVINSEAGLFYQVIQNLIDNAQKYAYDEGGIIDIEINDKGNEITLIFSDYGKGIPKEHLSKIYDAFFTTGGGSGGVGIGLNIVYRIITTQLKGEIVCDSEEGEGTTFIITVPKT